MRCATVETSSSARRTGPIWSTGPSSSPVTSTRTSLHPSTPSSSRSTLPGSGRRTTSPTSNASGRAVSSPSMTGSSTTTVSPWHGPCWGRPDVRVSTTWSSPQSGRRCPF